jgi:2,3-bisphosphoglycerate-dependent phosphoglycerate mutase
MPPIIFLTLIRHGRSLADDEQVYEGRYDSPLTEVGRKQYQRRAAGWLEEKRHFDLIIASTLQRAQTSARIIAETLQAPLVLDPDWMEIDEGPLAQLPFDLADKLYPEPAFRNPYEALCGSGESKWQVYLRAARAMESLVRRGPGSYLVVAHGGIINAALQSVCGQLPAPNKQGISFRLGDAGFASLRYKPDQHQWTFLEIEPGFFPE